MIWILRILTWTWLVSIFPVEGIVELDTKCHGNCNCCKNNQCHTAKGWNNYCTYGCIERHRGGRCYELCTHECVSCTNDVDICTECQEGFYPGSNQDCTSECPTNCRSCASNTRCTACKDGYYNQGGSTTCLYSLCPGNCECSDGTCIACKNGFFDTTVLCNEKCPPNCMTCSSTEKCNKCDKGFYNGYNLDRNAGPLFRNCTLKCRETCNECQSYDNCSQCISGRYGIMCDNHCSIGCKDGNCHTESGECSCSPHFVGNKCNECVTGKYGTYCTKTCPEYCNNGKCSKAFGHCTDGCVVETIIVENCDICKVGTHGVVCNHSCPLNCKRAKCDRNTGICSDGCEGNFKGDFCDSCVPGKYGANCEIDCSVKCANSLCDKDTGNCMSCTGNFYGNNCTACTAGFYGLNCRQVCSPQCLNRTCDTDSGICKHGCTNNYSGNKCCIQRDNCVECSSNTECQKCKSGYFGVLCENSCPVNCLDSCEMSTGVCGDCVVKYFGPFCNNTCSENCKALRSSDTSQCASSDGRCVFGCKDGSFGLICNKTCSSLCIDSVCKQDDGVCDKGCCGSNEDPVCVLDQGKQQVVYDGNSKTPTNIVLGTLLALTTTALCILVVMTIVRKIRSSPRRLTQESVFQIPLQQSLEVNQSPQNEDARGVSEAENTAYEMLDRTPDAPEHTYDTTSPSAPRSTVSVGNTDYMNLQIQRS